ncbi:MAG TPA: DEAD/DEAH box helicase [Spirochaetia bacterium]|nr:DEAD/DEAH box helicase [Spirochaetia bacterium]
MSTTYFESLLLATPILNSLRGEGYIEPTAIQRMAIPPLLEGRDLLGCAQTGTGKTAAFALPILQKFHTDPKRLNPKSVRMLVIAPTRELAAQIDASFGTYGRNVRFSRSCVFGGVSKLGQVRALNRGVDVLIATPGRLLDLHGEGSVRLDQVETVVLDEADRMLDMGFIRDIRRIVALLPKQRQTVLFSATMPKEIAELARSIQNHAVQVAIEPEKTTADNVDQKIVFVEKSDKRDVLTTMLHGISVERALVFTRTKHGADRLATSLTANGIMADAIHANKSQNARTRALDSFRKGSVRVLVATDLASRGIDVDGVTHVFNYELPNEAETYVHRIGRTARAGASGIAVSLCAPEERPLLKQIEKLIGRPIPTAVDAGRRSRHVAGQPRIA